MDLLEAQQIMGLIRMLKIIIDPKYDTNIEDLKKFKPDISFVCVPTPMSKEGNQNSDILKTVISDLSKHTPKTTIVIKSTVLPSVLEVLCKNNKNIVYNPEFQRKTCNRRLHKL